MKNPLVRKVSKWMLRAYILWSICADITLLGGIIYLVFWDQIYTEVTMKEIENCNGLRGSTGRLHHKDTSMWMYKCNVGEYTENSFFRLLYVIFMHRFSHLLKGEGFRDQCLYDGGETGSTGRDR